MNVNEPVINVQKTDSPAKYIAKACTNVNCGEVNIGAVQ